MQNLFKTFQERIRNKEIKIACLGLGYVGLPLAIEFAKSGFEVLGIEIDKERLSRIKRKESYITDVSDKELKQALDSAKFRVTADFSSLSAIDAIIICVPTPLKRKYRPDISYIEQAVKSISENLKTGSLIVLESTTYPGTTEEVILPLLEKNRLKHNRDFYLSFSPERIDPGNRHYPVNKIPKIVGGVSKEATELTAALYRNIIDTVMPVSTARTAEAVKLLENTFRLINIALIDELAMMAHKMNIDIWEVIEAASSKPFGFMPFYPGPGVGGHCLDKKETIFIKEENSLKTIQISDFIKYIRDTKKDVEVLSFDPIKKQSVFKKVIAASGRPYSGEMFDIATEDGRHIKVTDLHPMFIYNNNSWQLKYAKDLQREDLLPVCLELPQFSKQATSVITVDLIEHIWKEGRYLIEKIRVKPAGFLWKQYSEEIKAILRKSSENRLPDCFWDYLSDNFLPLKYFYDLDKFAKIDHCKLKLVTGRGPSYNEIPATITIDEDFCRLIGYYLSEGCYTKDKSARIRFSFNRSEQEYIQDVVYILSKLGIRTSIYESKLWHSSCIKVSSNLFGFLIYRILGCGNNCYNMNIPEQLFSLDKEKKKALIAGAFRGDASVEYFFGKWRYRKNEKEYFHKVNSAHISFFTSSSKLFHQLIILLHDLNIVPTFGKRKYTMDIYGYRQLTFFKDLFDGKKREIIETYLKLNKNRPKNKTFRKFKNFAVVKVKSVSVTKGDWVYSIETEKPHTFVTSYGIAVHNCIPKDPLYLYWKAKHFGFHSRFIKLASDIINYMPEYVADRLEEVFKVKDIEFKRAKILVVGVTYKKDIKDLRKSPSLDIIDILQKRNTQVSYFDPLIPYLRLNHINLKSITLKGASLKKFDCVVIATDHSGIDYNFIAKHSKLIFDTRSIYKGAKDQRIVKL